MESEAPSLTLEELNRALPYLDTLPQSIGRMLDGLEHDPAPRSIAEGELGALPELQVQITALTRGAASLTIAADHLAALQRSLTSPVMTFAPWTFARAVLEHSVEAMWPWDTEIVLLERAGRGMTLRLRDLRDQLRFAQAARQEDRERIDLGGVELHVEQRIAGLVRDAEYLKITALRGSRGMIGIGGRIPSITKIIGYTLGEAGNYGLLSAVAHGRSWAALRAGFRRTDNRQGSHTGTVTQDLSPAAAMFLIVWPIGWFSHATWSYWMMFGWDQAPLVSLFEEYADTVQLQSEDRFWGPSRK